MRALFAFPLLVSVLLGLTEVVVAQKPEYSVQYSQYPRNISPDQKGFSGVIY
jgi:hypothetical protein